MSDAKVCRHSCRPIGLRPTWAHAAFARLRTFEGVAAMRNRTIANAREQRLGGFAKGRRAPCAHRSAPKGHLRLRAPCLRSCQRGEGPVDALLVAGAPHVR